MNILYNVYGLHKKPPGLPFEPYLTDSQKVRLVNDQKSGSRLSIFLYPCKLVTIVYNKD